ncbi:metal ABC transporter solute-binding protein, Zn/Mn family [Psychrobacter sp. I-STPA6b]|uniref:metal ABC transporter solute-binding protein, Zn/Mn family n=1 Tax=Psychrobacter sp. I-STPA6b TaxID=2585718 RepID=UPI001D0C5B27|nr:zinc ABC transporter substrate-binding protein [Psychrobacter sp. I-STPA6b]
MYTSQSKRSATQQKTSYTKRIAHITATLLMSMSISAFAHSATNTTQQTIPAWLAAKTDLSVSNHPLFLLSEAVTKGTPSAHQLLGSGEVGHHGSLSPSDIKTAKDSRYVIWFGKELENNLANPFSNQYNTIALFDLNAFNRLPLRDEQGKAIEGTLDPHIWLDPENAKAITRALAAIYSRANPQYTEIYNKNVQDFAKRMDDAVASVAKSPSSAPKSYWAYHDAYQYIEPSLNIKLTGTLTRDHHLPPKATQFRWLQQNRPNTNMCMVMQGTPRKGMLNKLQPLATTVQQEDMSDATDFVTGWKTMANEILTCIK